MKIDLQQIEEVSMALYIRALKLLPPDIKAEFTHRLAHERGDTARNILETMVSNIRIAEDTNNLLCQDTGLPIYKLTIGSGVDFDGLALKKAIRTGCERATREHPLRSSVVHPLTRKNEHSSCGIEVPIIQIDFDDSPETLAITMVPKGSGSENSSFLKMAIPAEGIDAIKTFVIDCVLAAGGKPCPPTVVGVGLGGSSELCLALAKRAATRAVGTRCSDPDGAQLEVQLSAAVNQLGIGPQGLGGDTTAFAVQIELAATHITMNPIAVNMQCHSARRAKATITPAGVSYGF